MFASKVPPARPEIRHARQPSPDAVACATRQAAGAAGAGWVAPGAAEGRLAGDAGAPNSSPGSANAGSSNFSQVPLFAPGRSGLTRGSITPNRPLRLQQDLPIAAIDGARERDADRLARQAMGAQASAPVSLRPSADGERTAARSQAPRIVHDVVQESGSPLDAATRGFFEPRFGHDFSAVRLHSGRRAAASARAVRALAYTVGDHIVLGEKQAAGADLIAHELAHVVQHGYGDTAPVLARAPDPHQLGSSRSRSLGDLHDLLVKLLTALKRKTQLSIMGYKTVAIGLVEGSDEKGEAFQTIVYTVSGNWGSIDLESTAASLGITRWRPDPRAEGRGATGAPNDAEQLLIEGQDQADMTLLGMAVARNPCLDCAEAIRDEDVQIVFVDPAKHLAKRQRNRKAKPSAALENARSELSQAFSPQVAAPGQTDTTGLGPRSTLWGALNVLSMPELYRILEEASGVRKLSAIHQHVKAAVGVDNNRLRAPMTVLELKAENLKENPNGLVQGLLPNYIAQELALLPPDQSAFLLNQLYPHLHLVAPPKIPAPKRQERSKDSGQPEKPKDASPSEKAKETNSYVGPIIKALAAIGVGAVALDALADSLVAIAGAIFTDVVLKIVVEGAAKVPVRATIKTVVETALKEGGPKFRVLTEAVRQRVPEVIADELTPIIEHATHGFAGGL